MPTPEPPDVNTDISAEEKLAREGAVSFVRKILSAISSYSYGTRSHMPGGFDFTNFTNSVGDVTRWCEARPDWTLEIIRDSIGGMGATGSTADEELAKLRKVHRALEETIGCKLDEAWPHKNDKIAEALKMVMAAQEVGLLGQKIERQITSAIQTCKHSAASMQTILDEAAAQPLPKD